MERYFKQHIRFFWVVKACLAVLIFNVATAQAWTTARISNVDVNLNVESVGASTVVTTARFEIYGGAFHGFDLAPLEAGELIANECRAVSDDGRRYLLSFRKLFDGRTRVVLADKTSVGKGGITFFLIHKINLVEQGSLRKYAGRARLDWTPLIWDDGTDKMTIKITLPGKSKVSAIVVDPTVTKDYETKLYDDAAMFIKYRTVRWYSMQVVMEFDPALISNLKEELSFKKKNEEFTAAIMSNSSRPAVPVYVRMIPVFMVMFGLLLIMRKAWHLNRALADLNINARYRLLPNTGTLTRFALTMAASALGLIAQYYGSLASSVPALALAASFWIVHREDGSSRTRPGGRWRKMSEMDVNAYQSLAKAYCARRRSLIDISTVAGAVFFVIVIGAIGFGVLFVKDDCPRIAWATVINGFILIIPAWFAHVRSELPVDPTIEGFITLKKRRAGLSRLLCTLNAETEASFWVREDDKGTIEVRLRVESPPEGLKGIEIAGETFRSGSTYKTRKAVILRMEPGTTVARKMASCPYAVEHHLTPDLEEEIIVLHNRRGNRDAGLAPLRSALELL